MVTIGSVLCFYVGLPEIAVRESKDLMKVALRNSGYKFPGTRITINLI